MIRWNLKRIFTAKGILTPNKFLIQNGHSKSYASSLMNDGVHSVSLKKLEQLCVSLNCTPNDLFDFVPDNKVSVPEGHALNSIRKSDMIGEVAKLMQDLPMEKIEEMWGKLRG